LRLSFVNHAVLCIWQLPCLYSWCNTWQMWWNSKLTSIVSKNLKFSCCCWIQHNWNVSSPCLMGYILYVQSILPEYFSSVAERLVKFNQQAS
jgi:hypothetical protein